MCTLVQSMQRHLRLWRCASTFAFNAWIVWHPATKQSFTCGTEPYETAQPFRWRAFESVPKAALLGKVSTLWGALKWSVPLPRAHTSSAARLIDWGSTQNFSLGQMLITVKFHFKTKHLAKLHRSQQPVALLILRIGAAGSSRDSAA